MLEFLDIVTLTLFSLPDLAWFVYMMGAVVVCACAAITIRLLYWR